MRLWHIDLIQKLPREQLLGQHRECCALRGNGWGRRHATVDYVFRHPYSMLYSYHTKVMLEMEERGYTVDSDWYDPRYRGKQIRWDVSSFTGLDKLDNYPEHNDSYMNECLTNLKEKGAHLVQI